MSVLKKIKTPIANKKTVKVKEVSLPTSEELADELEKAIDKCLESKIEGRFKKAKGFSPSNTNECPRFLVYTFRGVYVPATHDARVQRMFDNGHAVHDRIYSYLDKMGILLDKEVKIETPDHLPVPIYGFADGIIEWNGRAVIEVKSIGEAGYAYRKIYKKPKDEHYRQIQLYLAALKIDRGFVIYENRNNQALLVIEVAKDDAFLSKLFKKYDKIYQNYLANILPDRPYKKNSTHCNYCDLKDLCWAENE
jgi:CRISPR/Cas system-associated exonuclease Cas4 (RecB family)